MNKPIRIAIAGAGGRMGRQLIQAINNIDGVVLGAAFEHSASSLLGADAGELAGVGYLDIKVTDDLQQQAAQFDILVDFTRPEATLAHLQFCVAQQKMMIIGTTGINEAGKKAILTAAQKIAIVFSANFSVGVNLVLKLLEKAAQVMGEYTDIEIIEAHHRHKVDAPSGTALAMGEAIAETMDWDLEEHAVYSRVGHTGERPPQSIGFATIRAGDIIGEHTAIFADIGERVEISHKASSRMTFANGAIRAAIWLNRQPKGLYNMRDVLGLDTL